MTMLQRLQGNIKKLRMAVLTWLQFGGSPVKAGEEEYQLFRDSE